MITQIILLLTGAKLLLIFAYFSTDFEVHRNWLAVTHSLPINKWYYDSTSQWTLDYPPLFAWLEYILSHIAKCFDPKMLEVSNLNYNSRNTILFQRLSVIATDLVYVFGVKRCSDLVPNGKLLTFILLISNPGLLMVDHIHFQYNGFLFGILLLSIADMLCGNYLRAAFWFAILLNLKHIYLYVAPVYVVYLVRAYCFTVPSKDGYNVAWYSFSFKNLFKLGLIVISVFTVSFGPFWSVIPQILSRLFPFKRGLSHAYWAPNFWALYNFFDKALSILLAKFGGRGSRQAGAMTSGLVQEYGHAVLPSVTPVVTFVLTLAAMAPALVRLWRLGADTTNRPTHFLRCLVICATSSFMFGWHVHEKAILLSIIPLTILAVLEYDDGKSYLMLSTVGHYSLFPLLFSANLIPIKFLMLLTHAAIGFQFLQDIFAHKKQNRKHSSTNLPTMNILETIYLLGLFPLFCYDNFIHSITSIGQSLPFLSLMITSVYCALGITYFWVRYYYLFLRMSVNFNSSHVKCKSK